MIKSIFGFLIYIISIILVILFWKENILLTIALILLLLIMVKLWHKRNDIYTIIFGIIFGWISESIGVFFGVWKYTNPTFLVPLWLPILWGIAASIIRRFTFFIERR